MKTNKSFRAIVKDSRKTLAAMRAELKFKQELCAYIPLDVLLKLSKK